MIGITYLSEAFMYGRTATGIWYSECSDYLYSSNTCADSKSCDHYKQVLLLHCLSV